MKKIVLGLLLISTFSAALAQKSEISSAKNNYALFEFNVQAKSSVRKQLEPLNLAKESIDKAVQHEKTKNLAEAWAYRALIYSAITVTDTLDKENAALAFTVAKESVDQAKALDKDNKQKSNIANAERNMSIAMQNKGVAAFNSRNYKEAFSAFKYIADVMPKDTLFNMYTAIAAKNAQLHDEAITYYKKTIDINPNDPVLYQELSRVYLSKSDTASALKTIEDARVKHPDNTALIFDELNIYLNKGEVASQISKIETAISKEPKNKSLYFVLGIAHSANKQTQQAEEAYKKAIEIDPNYADAIYNLAVIYIDRGNVHINEANKLPIGKSSDAKYNALKAKFEAELKNALPLLEKARTLNPKDYNVLTTLRGVYGKLNMSSKAEEVKKAIDAL